MALTTGLLVLAAVVAAGSVVTTPSRDPWFMGGGSNPAPPKHGFGLAPTTIIPGGSGPLLAQVLSGERHLVVLRDRRGNVLDRVWTDDRGRALLVAPAGGALLDVLGTDALGLPVVPWQHVTVLGHGWD